jgi:hypothetical protein
MFENSGQLEAYWAENPFLLAKWDDFRTSGWLKQIEITEVAKLMDNVRTYYLGRVP